MNINTPVLIVGGGTTGLSLSIALARHGVRSLLVERHPGASVHSKAIGISVRTMELFRAWGVDEAVRQVGLRARPEASDATFAISPVEAAVCTQDVLEPILLAQARKYRDADVRFDTELVSFHQDAAGVSAAIVDRKTGIRSQVRARYLLAADGASSPVRTMLGSRMIGIESVGAQVADHFRGGRIFLVGDAAYRTTPSGAFGMNSGIHDGHNLAWKIGAVFHGWAADALLDSYEIERRPVAERNVAWSLGLRRDMSLESFDLGAAYTSDAIAGDGPAMTTVMPDVSAPAWPGCRAPHVWLESDGRAISTLDLWKERFILLTGDGTDGDVWAACAWSAARDLSVPFEAFTIGPDGNLRDRSEAWHVSYGIERDGAVLVRPDGHIVWRARRRVSNPIGAIADALSRILGCDSDAVVALRPPPWGRYENHSPSAGEGETVS